MESRVTPRASFFSTFSKSQVSSLTASAVDYGTLFLCTEVFHVWYVIAVAAGAFLGAVFNFFINRHWSFQAAHRAFGPQAGRYALVSTGSLLLNTCGVYLVTEYAKVHYAISVVIVSLLVGFLFNYPLHRYYVYRV
jgi:putative flippase GtrA